MSNQAMLIFHRNLTIYLREKAFRMDFLFPIISAVILIIAKQKGTATWYELSEEFLPLSLIAVTRGVTTNLIYEKSARQKEIQKIMGVSQTNYVLGWLLSNLFRFFVVVIPFLIVVASVNLLGLGAGLSILSLLLYGLAQLAQAYFFSVFFDDPRSGGDLALFSNFLGIIFVQLIRVSYVQNNIWLSFVMALIPSFAFGAINSNQIFGSLAKLEGKTFSYDFGSHDAYYMLGADVIFYMLAYLYFDQVVENEYGTQKHPLFLFGKFSRQKSNNRPHGEVDLANLKEPLANSFQDAGDYSSAIYHEPFENHQDFKRAVQIDGLSRKFEQVQAVDNVSLCLYENQILTLLGHNGAGKTTTISLLTGLIEKDQGTIRFYGRSIDESLDEVRKYTGICPQRDVLYEELSIEEHLQFYARVKGVPEEAIEREVDQIINKCALSGERGKLAKNLSGGNRRKLCLGMAVIGGSRVIFLDEPTSGMDPVSRRKIWDILIQLKQDGKSLVLTTHHLDEAEVLSERIAIMAKGKLLTVGSTNFVKKNFGIGYNLSVFNNGRSKNEWVTRSEQIKQYVLSTCLGSKLNPQSAGEALSFQLAYGSKESFVPIFKTLEEDQSISIDLTMNTLEEAFVNIGMDEEKFMKETRRYSDLAPLDPHQQNIEIDKVQPSEFNDFSAIVAPECVKKSPNYSFSLQFIGCLLRRVYVLRGKRVACGLVLPSALIILGSAITLSNRDEGWESSAAITLANLVVIAFAMQSGSGSIALIMERQEKLKYALNVMGCRQLPYWLATLACDYFFSLFIVLVYVICIWSFNITPLKEAGSVLAVMCMSFSYINAAYLISWAFNDFVKAAKMMTLILIFGLFLVPLISFSTSDTDWVLYAQWGIFPSLPTYNVFNINSGQSQHFQTVVPQTYWSNCLMLVIQGVFYFYLCLSIDGRQLSAPNNQQTATLTNSEIDVIEEMQRVQNPACQDRVKAIKISKTYANGYQAVKGTSFGIEAGQILGLLGPNGAGKSTTFNMITARLKPTSGNIFLMGQQATKGNAGLYQHVGICPQFDCVWKNMKPQQHLRVFAYIKGLSGTETDQAVDYFIKVMQLSDFTNTPSDKLSGGNKRKLCVATALIGGTNMQFFDEPSSGVDPIARRFLWNTIQQGLKLQKGAVVLTTHTMDEAESLCHKIAIQVNGRFACIGTPQHLKQKYGSGYRATVDLVSEDMKARVIQQVLNKYPDAVNQEESINERVSFKIPKEGFVFSDAFSFFLDTIQKEHKLIKDFQINQSSLEQVFMYFASLQEITSDEGLRPQEQVKNRKIFSACFGNDEED